MKQTTSKPEQPMSGSIHTTLLFALSLSLTACSKAPHNSAIHRGEEVKSQQTVDNETPSDAAIRRQIVGTWMPTSSNTLTISSDGRLKIIHTDATLEGTWTVEDGFLTQTITNISGNHLSAKVGQSSLYEVVNIDEHELACRIPGQTNLLTARRQ